MGTILNANLRSEDIPPFPFDGASRQDLCHDSRASIGIQEGGSMVLDLAAWRQACRSLQSFPGSCSANTVPEPCRHALSITATIARDGTDVLEG
jgi:hypothetical protein